MTSPNLENLVETGKLKSEPPDRQEFDGLVHSARARLTGSSGDRSSQKFRGQRSSGDSILNYHHFSFVAQAFGVSICAPVYVPDLQ